MRSGGVDPRRSGGGPQGSVGGSGGEGSSLMEQLRNLDYHSAVSKEFLVHTSQGAVLSIITLAVIAFLTYSEYVYNFTPTLVNSVHANATTPDGLEIEFDISLPRIPCAILSVDANDPTGQPQSLHIDRHHRVWKHRMNKDGVMIGERSRFEMGNTMKHTDDLHEVARDAGLHDDGSDPSNVKTSAEVEEDCGSCYGAGEEDECCNTCDDVKRAYQRRGWYLNAVEDISQCKNRLHSKDEEGEGCNVHGMVAIDTGGGNLHLAPSRGLEKFGEGDGTMTVAEFISAAFETFNVSHTIHRLRFGQDEFPGHIHQLDDQERNVEDVYGMYQYYIKIVPTRYRFLNGTEIRTNQYSVTEHLRHVSPGSGRGLPGVFFFYEVSPLHVELVEDRPGWIRFLTSVCAIVGGCFTAMGMADRLLYSYVTKDNRVGIAR